MYYPAWILKLLIFFLIFVFSLKNTHRISVNFLLGYSIENIPLIIVLLASFAFGVLFCLFLTVGLIIRQKKEISNLRKENDSLISPL